MSIVCDKCGQTNSDWAMECGRCNTKFLPAIEPSVLPDCMIPDGGNGSCKAYQNRLDDIEELHKAIDDAYGRGRKDGLEQAAKIAETQFCCDDKEEEAIARAIRKVI